MPMYLSNAVICGEIINTTKNSVYGWLGLRDREAPVPLHLTGNCSPDLAGRHIRFQVREDQMPSELAEDVSQLAAQQVGPTGEMTALRLGKRCLYLEWYSQNGHVVLELPNPTIEFVEPDQQPSQTVARDEAVDFPALGFDPDQDDEALLDALDDRDDEEEEDDPYGLFSDELKQEFDSDARDEEPGLSIPEEAPEVMRELEMMDDLIQHGEEVPVGAIFDPPIKIPRPDRLSDDQAADALRTLLAEMAKYGIALDMCEHFTPRQAYQLLVEEICLREGAFPQLKETQWVQHFMTHDFCPECRREIDEQEQGAD